MGAANVMLSGARLYARPLQLKLADILLMFFGRAAEPLPPKAEAAADE